MGGGGSESFQAARAEHAVGFAAAGGHVVRFARGLGDGVEGSSVDRQQFVVKLSCFVPDHETRGAGTGQEGATGQE